MRFTTTTTSKGQLTIPKDVRDRLNLKPGIKVDIYPTQDGFIGKLHKKSRIMDFMGDLKHLDSGEPFADIRKKAQEIGSKDFVDRHKI